MKADNLSRMSIRDPRVAAVFTDPRRRRLLMWFANRPASVGEAAIDMDMDIRRAHYFVRRLLRLGLLEVAEERSRAGRAIKLYRTVSDAFFIPHEAAPKGFGDDLTRELRESLALDLARSDGGIVFTANEAGSVRGKFVGERGSSVGAAEMWRALRLRPRELAALKQDITALLDRYQQSSGGKGAAFLVHAAVAPRLKPEGTVDNEPRIRGAG